MKLIKGTNDLKTWCLENDRAELLEQWNDIKLPDEVAKGSDYKAQWKCKICGGEWSARVSSRTTQKCNCPYCDGKKVLKGFNDLYSKLKEEGRLNLIKNWDYETNENPDEYTYRSNKKICLICDKCGSKTFITPDALCKVKGDEYICQKCKPYKDYGLRHYDFVINIHTPAENRQITEKRKCRETGNNFLNWCKENNHLDLLKEFDKDNKFAPDEIAPHSSKLINWTCSKCGHKWSSKLLTRTRNQGNGSCPECAKRERIISRYKDNPSMASLELFCKENNKEYLLKEWSSKNIITPDKIGAASNEKVLWKCECGCEWEQRIYERVFALANSCPVCEGRQNISMPEKCVAFYIDKYFPDTITNYRPSWLEGKELDVFIPSLNVGIEYDGEHWHQDLDRDVLKNKLCKENNVSLIRVRENGCPFITGCSTQKVEAGNIDDLNKAIKLVIFKLGIQKPKINIEKDYLDIRKFHKI